MFNRITRFVIFRVVDKQKQNQSGFIQIATALIVILALTLITFVFMRVSSEAELQIPKEKPTVATASDEFSFTAAGDFSSSTNAGLVLDKIGKVKNDFTLALGDLGYGGNGTENSWCEFVKKRIGYSHPFELVAGNHDDGTRDGNILEYRKCLPDKIGKINGNYGLEYYFDYNRIARFILISPDIKELGYTYAKGSEHYNWLAQTIDDAKKNGIDWIVLGMHKNCISVGEKVCEIGEDLLNLAVAKKVDMILQGHEHAYMRSNQLTITDECPFITINATNKSCISGTGNELTKEDGSIIVVSGAGGMDLRDIQLDDAEKGYFNTWNGKNVGNSYGFSLFHVSRNKINGEFIPVVGDYTDHFSITKK